MISKRAVSSEEMAALALADISLLGIIRDLLSKVSIYLLRCLVLCSFFHCSDGLSELNAKDGDKSSLAWAKEMNNDTSPHMERAEQEWTGEAGNGTVSIEAGGNSKHKKKEPGIGGTNDFLHL